jgi:phenylacetate-CoA ligase
VNRGRGVFDALETAPPAQVVAAAERAWADQVATLAARSPFYARKWRNAGVGDGTVPLARLAELPLTEKDELRAAQEAAPPWGDHLGVPPESVVRAYRTSGTSGRPVVVALTAEDAVTWTAIGCRSYTAAGLGPGARVVTPIGAGPFTAGQAHFTLARLGTAASAEADTAGVTAALRSGLADSLLATPSFALHLEAAVAASGEDGRTLGLKRVVVGGEPGGGLPEVRRRIEAWSGAVVREVAGLGDIAPSLFAECDEGDGMHFCGQGLVWIELIDPADCSALPIEDGVSAELVYTALVRQAMPLVRFRSRDLATVSGDGGCPCGRTGPRVRIVGRTDDMVIVRGVNVYPSAVQAVIAGHGRPVTGRSRLVVPAGAVAVDPPLRVEAEVDRDLAEPEATALTATLGDAIRSRLGFRADVVLLGAESFAGSQPKTAGVARPPGFTPR